MDETIATTTTETVDAPVAEPETKAVDTAKPEKPVDPEIEKLKRLLSKANSEANSYKQQLREKQTEAERAEADRAEAERTMKEELESLRRDKAVGAYTNKCLALGFDAELAAQTANAAADGNMDVLFDECLKAFVEATTTRIKNEVLNRQPTLSTGVPPTTNVIQDEELNKLRRYAGLSPHR